MLMTLLLTAPKCGHEERQSLRKRRMRMKRIIFVSAMVLAAASPVSAQTYFDSQQQEFREQRRETNERARERQRDQIRQTEENLQRNRDRLQQNMCCH
jgi:gas vesicle protein